MNKKMMIVVFISLALLLFGCGGQTEEQTTETITEEEVVSATQTVSGEEGTGVEEMVIVEEGETIVEETPAEETAEEATPQTVEVDIDNYAFDEATITIKAGTTVVWKNYDSAQHTVTATSGAAFDSGKMLKEDTWDYTFTEPGTYEYYCTYHPSMKGTVVVE